MSRSGLPVLSYSPYPAQILGCVKMPACELSDSPEVSTLLRSRRSRLLARGSAAIKTHQGSHCAPGPPQILRAGVGSDHHPSMPLAAPRMACRIGNPQRHPGPYRLSGALCTQCARVLPGGASVVRAIWAAASAVFHRSELWSEVPSPGGDRAAGRLDSLSIPGTRTMDGADRSSYRIPQLANALTDFPVQALFHVKL